MLQLERGELQETFGLRLAPRTGDDELLAALVLMRKAPGEARAGPLALAQETAEFVEQALHGKAQALGMADAVHEMQRRLEILGHGDGGLRIGQFAQQLREIARGLGAQAFAQRRARQAQQIVQRVQLQGVQFFLQGRGPRQARERHRAQQREAVVLAVRGR